MKKTIMITGASSGIGACAAKLFLKHFLMDYRYHQLSLT